MLRKLLLFCLIYTFCVPVFPDTNRLQNTSPFRKRRSDLPENVCSVDTVSSLKETQQIGVCETFDGDSCLCELNSNCGYDFSTDKCESETDCSLFDGQATLCRENKCTYECATAQCIRQSRTALPGCLQCQSHCLDICSCKAMHCEYSNDGQCKERPTTGKTGCSQIVFPKNQCGRTNAFYLNNGIFCNNTKPRGHCDIEKTIAAVNIGGPDFTDSRGVPYVSKYDSSDPENIVEYEGSNGKGDFVGDNRIFYQQIMKSKTQLRENDRCISYKIPACEDGDYELVIKTIVTSDALPGEKTFNIKINGVHIFAEVDVMQLAQKTFEPIELITNFRIHKNLLYVDGFNTIVVKKGSIELSFCFGECMFLESGFEIAAFSVSKFIANNRVPTERDCKIFKGRHWDCESALCEYDAKSRNCTLKTGCSDLLGGCEEEEKCIELLFMVDNARRQTRNLPTDPTSPSFPVFRDLMETKLVEKLKSKYPCSKFGIALHNDVYFKKDGAKTHFPETYGCYLPRLPLTDDINKFKKKADISTFSDGICEDEAIPLMVPSILAAQDLTMKWTKGNNTSVLKVFVVVTHRSIGCTERDYWPTRQPKGDGTDDCKEIFEPSYQFTRDLLTKEGIHFFVITVKDSFNGNKVPSLDKYKDWFEKKVPVPHKYIHYQQGQANVIADELINFVSQPPQRPPLTPLVEVKCDITYDGSPWYSVEKQFG